MSAQHMKKAAVAGEQAAFGKTSNATTENSAPRSFRQRIKQLIVTGALWGLLPIAAADWLIQRGGLRHE